MADPSPIPNALDIVGRLMVEMGDGSARVECLGDSIVVELPSLRAGRSILRQWPGGRRLETIRRVHEGLTAAGLTLRVDVGRRTVGLLGLGARSGLSSRLLGLGPLELRLGGLLGSARPSADRPGRER